MLRVTSSLRISCLPVVLERLGHRLPLAGSRRCTAAWSHDPSRAPARVCPSPFAAFGAHISFNLIAGDLLLSAPLGVHRIHVQVETPSAYLQHVRRRGSNKARIWRLGREVDISHSVY